MKSAEEAVGSRLAFEQQGPVTRPAVAINNLGKPARQKPEACQKMNRQAVLAATLSEWGVPSPIQSSTAVPAPLQRPQTRLAGHACCKSEWVGSPVPSTEQHGGANDVAVSPRPRVAELGLDA